MTIFCVIIALNPTNDPGAGSFFESCSMRHIIFGAQQLSFSCEDLGSINVFKNILSYSHAYPKLSYFRQFLLLKPSKSQALYKFHPELQFTWFLYLKVIVLAFLTVTT